MTWEQWLSCLVIWREARGESLQAKTGVWHVLQNRMADEQRRWPRTLAGVICQHEQFSSMTTPGDPGLVTWPVAPTPAQVSSLPASADWKAFLDCQTVVLSALNADPTLGATFYESYPTPPDPKKMPWFDPGKLTVQIGKIRFYRN